MKLEKIIQRSTKNCKDKIKTDKTRQKLTKQDDKFKEGKLKMDNNQIKLDSISAASTQNRRESTEIVQNRQRTNHNQYNKNRQKR